MEAVNSGICLVACATHMTARMNLARSNYANNKTKPGLVRWLQVAVEVLRQVAGRVNAISSTTCDELARRLAVD